MLISKTYRSESGALPVMVLVAGAVLVLIGIGFGFVLGKMPSTKPSHSVNQENEATDSFELKDSTQSGVNANNQELSLATPTPSPTPKPTPKPTVKAAETTGSFSASAVQTNDGVKITWTIDGEAPDGFKVIKSLNANPTYPTRDGDSYEYLGSKDTRHFVWSKDLENGKTYHFRVGIYEDGTVKRYSNDVSVTIHE